MNAKPNLPDEIWLGREEYSWRMDWQVNGWLFAATLVSGFSDIIFPRMVSQWPLGWRVGIVVAEFLLIALWARSLTNWIRGMDELHRRITVSAVLFAVSATFFIAMLWHRLDSAGLFESVFGKPEHGGSWDICTLGHEFLLLTLFYFLGQNIFSRRYQ